MVTPASDLRDEAGVSTPGKPAKMRAGSVILLVAREQRTPSDLLQGARSTPQTVLRREEPSPTSGLPANDPQERGHGPGGCHHSSAIRLPRAVPILLCPPAPVTFLLPQLGACSLRGESRVSRFVSPGYFFFPPPPPASLKMQQFLGCAIEGSIAACYRRPHRAADPCATRGSGMKRIRGRCVETLRARSTQKPTQVLL